MQRQWVAAVALCLSAGVASAQALKTDDEKMLYTIGLMTGQQLGVFQLSKADLQIVLRGIQDQLSGAKAQVSMQEYGPKLEAFARTRNETAGKAYEEKAAKEKGAQKTASGLVYIEQKAGTGAAPKKEDTVKVHYRGALINGNEFDSSYSRNEPTEFPLGNVIPCWTEGLQKMKVGGKAKLVCPGAIAYGERGQPRAGIPPMATLVFDVELLEVKGAAAPATPSDAPKK